MQSTVDSFQLYRPLLFSVAYRMTGSASEAEDIVQDTYLRYQQVDISTIHSLKSYLTTIVINLCLNYLKSARAQREEYIGIWLPEPVLTSSADTEEVEVQFERQEAISLAFLVLLETLTPPERAVFLLHEVFDYSFAEVAEIIGKSPENCRQLLHRAKMHVTGGQRQMPVSPETQRRLTESFVAACQSGNLSSLTQLLASDVTAWADGGGKVRAGLVPVSSRETVARLCITLMRRVPMDHELFMEEINGSLALLSRSESRLNWVLAFDIDGDAIKGLRSILNPEKLAFLQRQLERRE